MRLGAWTAVLHRELGLPVALSVALHGLVGIALGAFTLSSQVASTQLEGLKVEFVTLESEPVTPPPARKLVPPMGKQPVEQATVPAPSFLDVPRTLAPAASPVEAFAEAVVFSVPDPTALPVSPSESVGIAPHSRALPLTTSGSVRLLRDTTAEAGYVRSKVRFAYHPRPEYPLAAREAGWEGTAVLQFLVLPDGTVGSVTLQKTSGYAVLDEAALSSVKTWRFAPAMDGNFPITSVVRLPIRFDLKAAD